MPSAVVADPGPGGDWPSGTVPLPEGVVRHRLRDTDVMDPFLPEELFDPVTGAWRGRGFRPEPAPELWAEVWGVEWLPADDPESSQKWSLGRLNFEATCFGVGFTVGSPWGRISGLYCGIAAVIWARFSWSRFDPA